MSDNIRVQREVLFRICNILNKIYNKLEGNPDQSIYLDIYNLAEKINEIKVDGDQK